MFDLDINGFDIADMLNTLPGDESEEEEEISQEAQQQSEPAKSTKITPNSFMQALVADSNKTKEELSKKVITPAPEKPKKREWSEQQKAIFEKFKNRNSGHVTIIARAGSSKTTTSIEGGKYAPELKIIYAAFGNAIAKELSERLPNERCVAQTTHSMGWGIIKQIKRKAKLEKSAGFLKVEKAADIYFKRKENAWDHSAKEYIKDNSWHPAKIFDLVRQCSPYAQYVEEILDVAVNFDLFQIPDQYSKPGERRPVSIIEQVCNVVLLTMELSTEEAINGDNQAEFLCDFTDMIWLPVRCGWVNPRFPLVIIDEAQDLSFTQIELASGICSGRIFLVGDDRQAIYGWRGADSDSLDRMTKQLGSTVMYLTTCYRCAKSIVRYAQKYVPDIEPWEHSPEGEVLNVGPDKLIKEAQPGDFVVCRTNAPLMSVCLRLISAGKKAIMAGNDIGKKLLKILSDVEGSGKNKNPFIDNNDMWQRLIAWGIQEKNAVEEMVKTKFTNAKKDKIEREIERRVEIIRDQLGMFSVLKKKFNSPEEIKKQLVLLFEDTENNRDRSKNILCCSVHKSKGLEAKNVFVLFDYLRTTTEEEVNICYVAVTRAQERLFLVHEGVIDEDDDEEYARNIDRSWKDVKNSRPSLVGGEFIESQKDKEFAITDNLKRLEEKARVDLVNLSANQDQEYEQQYDHDPKDKDEDPYENERYDHLF